MSSKLNGTTHRGSASRFEAIDGLRALAVLSVIAFHFGIDIAPSGFIGVDIFFVISGYVITLSLTQNTGKSILQYIAEFYKRRILRIMPALIFCLLIVCFFSQLFVPDSWLSESNNKTGAYAFFGLSNFALLSRVDGYFFDRAEFNPFLHTWSLAVEEQFYLFFPLLLLPWLRRRSDSSIKTYLSSNLVLFVGLISLFWSAIEASREPQLAFYMLPSRFWELAFGALLFQCHSSGRCITSSIIGIRTITSIGVTLFVFGIISANAEAFPFPWALAPVVSTLMLISAARSPNASKSLVISALKKPLVVYIGRSSYSLYLWHWPVVVLMRWTIGIDTAARLAFAFVLTLILGFASYHLIEKPFLRSKPLRLFPAWKIVPSGLALTVGFLVVFYVIIKSPIHLSITTIEKGWNPGDLPNNVSSVSISPEKPASTLWVIGDSHAGAYRGMVREAAAKAGMKFQIRELSGCSVANLREPYPDTNYCKNRFNRLFEELASNYSTGDIVFLASLRGQRLSDQWGMYEPDKLDRILNENRREQYRKALGQSREIVGHLLSIGYAVIIDTPKPVFRAPLFRCSDWFNCMNPVCAPGFEVSASELKDLDAPVLESLHILKAEFPDLIVWDPFPILCPDKICSAFREGMPLFFDQDHLSGYGNQLLIPSFLKLLSRVNQRQIAQQKHPADSYKAPLVPRSAL